MRSFDWLQQTVKVTGAQRNNCWSPPHRFYYQMIGFLMPGFFCFYSRLGNWRHRSVDWRLIGKHLPLHTQGSNSCWVSVNTSLLYNKLTLLCDDIRLGVKSKNNKINLYILLFMIHDYRLEINGEKTNKITSKTHNLLFWD